MGFVVDGEAAAAATAMISLAVEWKEQQTHAFLMTLWVLKTLNIIKLLSCWLLQKFINDQSSGSKQIISAAPAAEVLCQSFR